MIEQSGPTWNGIPTFKWKGHYWITRPLWGVVHQDDHLCYVDVDQPEILDNGNILLPFEYKPFEGRPFGRGWVRSIEEWKYGTFEWKFIIPEGEWLWPAIWLGSDAGWPPEIDMLEGWSADQPNYVKRLFWKNIHPTMHWSANADEQHGTHLSEAKFNTPRCCIKGNGKVNTGKVVWTPNYVDIYYNGWRLKRFNNPEMLKHFNKEGYRMHAIMSMSLYGPKWAELGKALMENDNTKSLPYMPITYNDFEIVDFKYSPIQ